MSRKPYKVHFRRNDIFTLCFLNIAQPRTHDPNNRLPLARRPDQVTCCNCLTIYYKDDRK